MPRRVTRPRYEEIPSGLLLRAEIGKHSFNFYQIPDDSEEPIEDGKYVISGDSRSFSLTDMTAADLDVFEQFMVTAIGVAREQVQRLDAEAEAAADQGNYLFRRLWRMRPRLIDFRGDKPIVTTPTTGASR